MSSYRTIPNEDIDVIMSWNKEELLKNAQQVGSVVNRRLKRFEKSNNEVVRESPAYKNMVESGGGVYTRGKSLNELRHEYLRGVNFLNLKTSSIQGFKKVKKNLYDRLEVKIDIDVEKRLWEIYNKLNEKEPFFVKRYDSDSAQKNIITTLLNSDLSNEEILELAMKRITDKYENETDRTSRYNSK